MNNKTTLALNTPDPGKYPHPEIYYILWRTYILDADCVQNHVQSHSGVFAVFAVKLPGVSFSHFIVQGLIVGPSWGLRMARMRVRAGYTAKSGRGRGSSGIFLLTCDFSLLILIPVFVKNVLSTSGQIEASGE